MKKTLPITFLSLLLIFSQVLSAQESIEESNLSASITSINHQSINGVLEVDIFLEGEFTSEYFELQDPHRLVLQFSPIEKILVSDEIELNSPEVQKIRIARYSPQVARLIFDLEETPVNFQIQLTDSGVKVIFKSVEKTESIEETIQETPKEIETSEKVELYDIETERKEERIIVNFKLRGTFEYKSLKLAEGKQILLDIRPAPEIIISQIPEISDPDLDEISLNPIQKEILQITLSFSRKISSFKVEKTESGISTSFIPEAISKAAIPDKEEAVQPAFAPKEKVIYPSLGNTMIEFSWGKHHVPSKLFTEIYGSSSSMYSLSFSRVVFKKDNHNFLISLGGRYFFVTGAATVTEDPTEFSMIPLSLSANYLINSKYLIPYIGLGLEYIQYKEKFEMQDTSGSTIGYHLEGGTYLKIPKAKLLFFKLYFKLSTGVAKENDIEIDLGGMEIGLGLSFSFDFLE